VSSGRLSGGTRNWCSPVEVQRHAAGDEDVQFRGSGQQAAKERTALNQVLHVVDDQQQLCAAQRFGQLNLEVNPSRWVDPQGAKQRGPERGGAGDRSEVGERDTRSELWRQLLRDGESDPRFPGPAEPSQGDQARLPHHGDDRSHNRGAADERRDRTRRWNRCQYSGAFVRPRSSCRRARQLRVPALTRHEPGRHVHGLQQAVDVIGRGQRAPADELQGVLLKVQEVNVRCAGAIAVVYDARRRAVRVSTLRLAERDWTQYGNRPAVFANGDRLTGCVTASGEVRIYRNTTHITSVALSAPDKAFFNAKGGKLGCGQWRHLKPCLTTSGVARLRRSGDELMIGRPSRASSQAAAASLF
jgi:hypothetical protein